MFYEHFVVVVFSRLVILSLFHVTGVLRESIYRGREELKKHHYNNYIILIFSMKPVKKVNGEADTSSEEESDNEEVGSI